METRPYPRGVTLLPYSTHAEKIILRELRRELGRILKEKDPDINPADADFFAGSGMNVIRCTYRKKIITLCLSHGFFRKRPRQKKKTM